MTSVNISTHLLNASYLQGYGVIMKRSRVRGRLPLTSVLLKPEAGLATVHSEARWLVGSLWNESLGCWSSLESAHGVLEIIQSSPIHRPRNTQGFLLPLSLHLGLAPAVPVLV